MRIRLLTIGVACLVSLFAMTSSASPFDQLRDASLRIAEFQPAPESRFLPGKPRARAGEKKAASRAKSAFPQSKILSVNYVPRKDSYRLKLLSIGGVVKYVFFAPSGEVIE